MSAISADTMVLPRIPEPEPAGLDRPVVSVTTAPSGFEGEGVPVRRAFAGVDLRALDPFVLVAAGLHALSGHTRLTRPAGPGARLMD